ncbi:hypothetical protein [Marinicella sp. W31]|uniref:hypothetical protein n=1 Tax=Marinicella sp. W31 TaxID=3023713 RepID=UPI00375648C7
MLSNIFSIVRWAIVIILWPFVLLSNSHAGIGACDDLNAITETPQVNFELEIQPILTTHCVGCHSGPNPAAFLDLSVGYTDLVDVDSFEVSGFKRVEPGSISRSYLFIKINCSNQIFGNRMPLNGNPLNLIEQALIRDWIRQLLIFRNGFDD